MTLNSNDENDWINDIEERRIRGKKMFFIYIEIIKLLKAYTDTNRVDRTLDEDLLLLVSADENRVHGKLVAHPKKEKRREIKR